MIVITTPAGRIGSQVLDNVLEGGSEPVRVVARDPSRLPAQVRERVEVVQGSHDDVEVVTEAFAGAASVFWLVPPDFHAESPEDYYLGFTRAAREAIKGQGVERVVAVTSLGRGFGKNAGLLSAAFAMDELIEGTGVDYRALGMPFFMENLLAQVGAIKGQGTFFLANDGDRPLATVATRDVAAAASALLLDGSWSGQGVVPVVGPDDLSPNGMARIMSEVLERPIRFRQVPAGSFKATMVERGASEAWAQGMADMAAAQNEGIYDAEQRTAQPAPTSFRRWCEEVLKPTIEARTTPWRSPRRAGKTPDREDRGHSRPPQEEDARYQRAERNGNATTTDAPVAGVGPAGRLGPERDGHDAPSDAARACW